MHWLLLILFFSYSHLPTEDGINWRLRRVLQWSDFKAKPSEFAPNAALTSTSILFSFRYQSHSLSYRLKCVFYPEKSWTKVRNAAILQHEQGHFDISQLFTRKLHKTLREYRFLENTADRDIKNIYQKIADDQTAYQKQYDHETNYSRNASMQAEWLGKIAGDLDSMKLYADYPE